MAKLHSASPREITSLNMNSSIGGTLLLSLVWSSHSICMGLEMRATLIDVMIASAVNCPVCFRPFMLWLILSAKSLKSSLVVRTTSSSDRA